MQIWELFDGYDKAHGRYAVKRTNDRGKKEGSARTVKGPPTHELWDQHLVGQGDGLGVIPLRADDTVVWGCIDVDVYPLDLAAVEANINKHGFPLVVCRTKSGGAHCFLFTSEPVDADIVIKTLHAWAAVLGYGGSEVFPKQSTRFDETQDIGNWLNMPYYYADRTNRYGIKDGEPLDLRDFLEYAESKRVDYAFFDNVPTGNAPLNEDLNDGWFEEGPPCLQVLYANGGFPDGTRNEGMFNVAVYLRKRFPDDWKDKIGDYNSLLCDPPLTVSELNTTIKSVDRKGYEFRCKNPPIAQHCNRRLCLSRNCGVGESASGQGRPEILDVKKVVGDPIIWYMTVNGTRIQVTTEELATQPVFKRRLLDEANIFPRSLPDDRWSRFVHDLAQGAEIEYAPYEGTSIGQFHHYLTNYLIGVSKTAREEDLLRSDAPLLSQDGLVYFSFTGLQKYLKTQGFQYKSNNHLIEMLKSDAIGARTIEKTIKGKQKRLWVVEAPPQLEDNDNRPVKQEQMGDTPF